MLWTVKRAYAMNNEIFLLVACGLGKATIIAEGDIKIIQARKTQLKKQPQYKSFDLQVRTKEGFAAKKVLTK